ncbi:RidA family protein [Nonomuraea sp. FMUSA5-5]|uniref:RidA family protein n=1 Tax=Nonomuraea composti TaxID=2720023 RepID=A0ABX1BMN8_9ACTN|nr:RidA family protein [Nonomuraea sp. FMUSA5-5]NJP97084.1 RidA family protein [Nonomuraea sp. FMUSA5-5]
MSVPAEAPQVVREESVRIQEAHGFRFADGAVCADSLTYAPASVVRVGNARFVFISGHTGTAPQSLDRDGQTELTLADEIFRQSAAALAKIESVLHSLHGTMEDIVRVRVYVRAPLTKEVFEAIHDSRRAFFGGARKPASTLVRIDALVRPDALIEIDADAVITDRPDVRPEPHRT